MLMVRIRKYEGDGVHIQIDLKMLFTINLVDQSFLRS
jgi:hypothetical protein